LHPNGANFKRDAVWSGKFAANLVKLAKLGRMKWCGIKGQTLRAQIVEKLIGIFDPVTSLRQERRFIAARLANEKVASQFFATDCCIRGQFHGRASVYQRRWAHRALNFISSFRRDAETSAFATANPSCGVCSP